MENEMIEFAKWFIHTRRMELNYLDNVNAVEFASNLMSELCQNDPFDLSPVMKEYKNTLEIGKPSTPIHV